MGECVGPIQNGFDGVNGNIDGIKTDLEVVKINVEGMKNELRSHSQVLKDHTDRLDRIESKQPGMLNKLDETVPRREFTALTTRVSALEKKSAKK